MSIPPPLRKLQYVLAVARELHFRRAAERLNVSQPYISRQIKEFEADIGFNIFRRDPVPHRIRPGISGQDQRDVESPGRRLPNCRRCGQSR